MSLQFKQTFLSTIRAYFLGARCRCAALLFVTLVTFLTLEPSAFAQTSAGPAAPSFAPTTTQPAPTQSPKDWRRGMAHVPPPKQGCFTSSYPSTQWQEVPCTTAPAIPYRPARGPRPDTVGNGNDVSAKVTGHITEAVGSFDSVTGVTSETGTNPYTGATNAPNVYSLQLNSNSSPPPPARARDVWAGSSSCTQATTATRKHSCSTG